MRLVRVDCIRLIFQSQIDYSNAIRGKVRADIPVQDATMICSLLRLGKPLRFSVVGPRVKLAEHAYKICTTLLFWRTTLSFTAPSLIARDVFGRVSAANTYR